MSGNPPVLLKCDIIHISHIPRYNTVLGKKKFMRFAYFANNWHCKMSEHFYLAKIIRYTVCCFKSAMTSLISREIICHAYKSLDK